MDRSSWTMRKVASDPSRQSFRRLGGRRACGELDRLLFGGEDVFEEFFEYVFDIAAGDCCCWGVVGGAGGELGLFDRGSEDEEIFE